MKLTHFSWTQYNTLLGCGEEYRRRYDEKERVADGLARIVGRSSHTSIEQNLSNRIVAGELLPLEELQQIAVDSYNEATAETEWVADGAHADLSPKEALGRGMDETVDFTTLHAEEVAPDIRPTAIEVQIELPPYEDIIPVPFWCRLDIVHDIDDVRDTKTTRKAPPKGGAELSDQLTLQALAFGAKYGRLPRQLGFDYLVRTPAKGNTYPVHQRTTRDKRDLEIVVRRVGAAINMVEREVYIPAPQDHWKCSERFCGYARTGVCPYFRGRPRPTN